MGMFSLCLVLIVNGCGLGSQGTPAERLKKAREFETNGKISAALIELKNLLQQDPNFNRSFPCSTRISLPKMKIMLL